MAECNQEATDLIIYILSQSSSVPTSWLQCRALVSIFHNGCFVPSKTKELLSPPAKDHRLFFSLSSQVGWGFIEFLVILTFWRNPDNRSGQAEYTLTLGFCSLLKHLWTKPLNIFFETYWPGDPIKFVCFIWTGSSLPRLAAGAWGSPGARCLSVSLSSVSALWENMGD